MDVSILDLRAYGEDKLVYCILMDSVHSGYLLIGNTLACCVKYCKDHDHTIVNAQYVLEFLQEDGLL